MKVLIPHNEIIDICKRIGKELTEKFSGKFPIVVCVLKGAAPFHSELIKHIKTDIEVDYIQVSSYVGTQRSGVITFKKDFGTDIEGRDVIIVEDIVDSGKTLTKLNEILKTKGAKSTTFVTMLDKPSKRTTPFVPDYIGKTIDDLFVIGFGLDLDEKYRNLEDICIFEE